MKKSLYRYVFGLLAIPLLLGFGKWDEQGLTFSKPQRGFDYCNLFGAVYIEENPNRADFKVYEEETEAFAHLLVYEEENTLYADRTGIWYFTEDPRLANFSIYFTEGRKGSQFSVYFTDTESFAGCNN